MHRSRCSATLAIVLGVVLVPAASRAQSATAGGRQSRPARDTAVALRSTEMRLARLRIELDSITDQLADDALSDAERRALVEHLRTVATSMVRLSRASAERAAVAEAMSAPIGESVRARLGGSPPHGTTIIRMRDAERALVGTMRERSVFKGWIGLNTLGVQRDSFANGEIFIRYVGNYPRIVSVDPKSPAADAGILKGDLLVAYDGSDVVEQGFNVTKLLQPARSVRITIDRGGDKRDVPVVVAPAPKHVIDRRVEFGIVGVPEMPAPPGPRSLVATPVPETPPADRPLAIAIAPPGDFPQPRTFLFRAIADATILGARVEQIDEDLSEIFGVSSGVVVIRVPDEAPARRAGLRGGDVIVKVDGTPVESVLELRRAVERAAQRDRTLDLGIVRNRKPASITLQW